MSRIVIALGGNALGNTAQEQQERIEQAAPSLIGLIKQGNEILVSHGNGPQVGMINMAMTTLSREDPSHPMAPLSVCTAMSQGYIGYDLQNALRTELIKRGIYKPVSTILTQVTVDPYDESSYTPLKVVGRTMTAEEAKAEEEKGNFTVKTENGYRRIVAAPRPVAIVEIDAIKALLEADQLVIAAGGGGIPVMEQGSSLKGASAIIEKDRAAGLLAKETDADVLMFLTGVDNVSLNYGTDHEVHLDKVTAADADRYAKEGQFSAGSMLPKIEASIDFINAGKGRHAIITSMDMAKDALAGRGGTTIA